jgi:hypothetical protein
MGATSLLVLVTVVLALYISPLVRASRLRKRITKWSESHASMTDEQFYESLKPMSVPKEGAISVRSLVSGAVRIPQDLVYPDDTLSDLKKIGDPSHPSVVDYIADMSSIESVEEEDDLTTVRDLVAKFGLALAQSESEPRL